MRYLASLIASFFGAGYSPVAPGTVGSLLAVIIIYVLSLLVDNMRYVIPILAILSYGVGILSISKLPDTWAHDDGRIVIDEAHGIFIALAFIPFSVMTLVLGLVVFRFFDILKPFGIRKLDKWYNNHGVMLDDTLAGIYSNIVLQFALLWQIVPI
ncbi:MAG: phosphatidylglycerophosphatase A [Saprospiraceae bacterium]